MRGYAKCPLREVIMRAKKVLGLGVGVLLLALLPVSASHRIYQLCFGEIFVPEIPPIVVGCEVIDCCPGCPGPDPIDWRIRVKGDPIESVVLKFENISPETMRELKVVGNGKWIKPGILRAGRGELVLRGFKRIPGARAPVAALSFEVNEALVRKALDGRQAPDVLGDFELTIEQMIGPVVVNEYKLTYHFSWCWHPWHCLRLPILQDRIDLDNNDGNDSAIVLLDANRSSGCVVDEIWRGNDIIEVGSVLPSGTCDDEIAIFSDDDAMQLITPASPPWTTPLGDLVPGDMTPNRLQDQVTVWLTAAATQPRAQAEFFVADLLYNLNNTGIGFLTNVNYQVIPAAQVTNVTNTITNVWNTRLCTGLPPAVFNTGQLNVYYVNSAFTGWWCAGSNVIGIGTTAQPESLSHEFGHAYSLGHTNVLAGFGNNNIMWGGGTGRTDFTVGQAYRVNVHTGSTLNTNGTRAGLTRNCNATPSPCPALVLDSLPK